MGKQAADERPKVGANVWGFWLLSENEFHIGSGAAIERLASSWWPLGYSFDFDVVSCLTGV